MKCPKCFYKPPEGAKFCNKCRALKMRIGIHGTLAMADTLDILNKTGAARSKVMTTDMDTDFNHFLSMSEK
jgi:hypothetical protein